MNKTFTFAVLPTDLEELKKLGPLDDPFKTAALAVLVFNLYPDNQSESLKMLDYLKGPEDLSNYDKSFISDRFSDKDYVPRSYFKGAKPENDYTPDVPYVLEIEDNPYSYNNENYATLYLRSGGADSARSVRLRKKPSTGEWFIVEYGGLLMSIREPKSLDKWA